MKRLVFFAEDAALRSRLTECLETILNKAQEPPKSKKVQHSNAKNAVLFEAIALIIHHDRQVIHEAGFVYPQVWGISVTAAEKTKHLSVCFHMWAGPEPSTAVIG